MFWIYILWPCCTALFILHRFETVLLLMGFQKHNKSVLVHLFILFIYVSSVFVSARVVQPLLQNYGKPIFRSNFHSIYDTSNYGVFHLSNGLALTPQMGWNSWNFFACNINETVIKETGFLFFDLFKLISNIIAYRTIYSLYEIVWLNFTFCHRNNLYISTYVVRAWCYKCLTGLFIRTMS